MRLLDKIEEYFCGAALLTATLIVFTNVILRYVFKAGTSWAEELVKYLMIWITFIGSSICVRKKAHVSIDFFYEMMPIKSKRVATIIIDIVALFFTGSMAFYGSKLVQFSISTGQVSPALQLPMWVAYSAIPLGFILMSFRLVQNIYLQVFHKEYLREGGVN